MTDCPQRNGDRCAIAAAIYEQHVAVTDPACAACAQQPEPRAINSVTVSLALSGALWAKDHEAVQRVKASHGNLVQRFTPQQTAPSATLDQIRTGHGPGSELHRLLATLNIHPGDDCGCVALAAEMNRLGPEGCRRERARLVATIRARQDQYGWRTKLVAGTLALITGLAWKIDLADPIGSLFDEAVRRADAAAGRDAETRRGGDAKNKPSTSSLRVTASPRLSSKLILATGLPPGDVLTMTAAVESLHASYPGQYVTDVRTNHPAIWQHNPHISPIPDDDPDARRIDMHYPAINQCNQVNQPFLDGYTRYLGEQLGIPLRLQVRRPTVYLAPDERARPLSALWPGAPDLAAIAAGRPLWIVNDGIKRDYTCKAWPLEYYQEVIDRTADKVCWVQIGLRSDLHTPLHHVVNLIDGSPPGPPLRELLVLASRVAGGLGPVTMLQHLLAAFDRPYICLVGGREPATWVQYPVQHTLHTIGQLDCCRDRACWKARVVPLNDGKDHDHSLCTKPRTDFARPAPECLARIRPSDVVAIIERCLS